MVPRLESAPKMALLKIDDVESDAVADALSAPD
jgi:hypothetical protein